MAQKSYVEKEGVKAMPWSTFFTRTSNIPLDRSSIFGSYEDALKYAKGNELEPDSRNLVTASYIGQIITVYENDNVEVYKITPNRTLEELGRGKGTTLTSSFAQLEEIAQEDISNGQLILCTDTTSTDEDYQGPGLYLVLKIENVVNLIKIFGLTGTYDIVIDGGTY